MAVISYWGQNPPASIASSINGDVYRYVPPRLGSQVQIAPNAILRSYFTVQGAMIRGQNRGFFSFHSRTIDFPYMDFIPILRSTNSVMLPDVIDLLIDGRRETFEMSGEAILYFVNWGFYEGIIQNRNREPLRVEPRDIVIQEEGVGYIAQMVGVRQWEPVATLEIHRARLFTTSLTGDLSEATVTRVGD